LTTFGVVVLGAGLLAGCASPHSPDAGGGPAAVGPVIPLTSSTVVGTTTWATLAMGHLDDPLNTFWQLLALTGGASWQLATPPGVASNGGLAISALPTTVLAGFGPSQDLLYSPLARTSDQGSSWQPGVLPAGLSPVPDALVEGDKPLALLSTAGGKVVAGTGDLSTWTPVTTAAALRRQPAAAGCHLRSLTAVTIDADGSTVVGASCTRGGRVGLFASSSTGFMFTGPDMPGADGGSTQVVRLDQTAAGTAALVSTGSGPAARLFGMWSTDGLRTWTVSAALPLNGSSLLSTGVTAAGGFVVTARGGGTARSSSTLTPAGSPWRPLPPPPSGTTAVTATPVGGYDALAPVGSTLSVYGLVGGGWTRVQQLRVAIQYGSSN
jgi:hypothetical protein